MLDLEKSQHDCLQAHGKGKRDTAFADLKGELWRRAAPGPRRTGQFKPSKFFEYN